MSLPPSPPLSSVSDHDPPPKRHGLHLGPLGMSLPPRPSLLSTLSLPQEYLDRYRRWVLRNASSVSQMESALRSLNYIIPSRIRDGELLAETYHSSVQLLSLYHDNVLLRAVSKLPGMPPLERPLNRYTRHWTLQSAVYRRTALLLQCIRYTELLWEMAAKRRGERVRWRVVVLLETLKALCRLLLLRVTGGRMLVPPLPERDAPPEDDLPALSFEEEMGLAPTPTEAEPDHGTVSPDWTMPRTGLKLPSLPLPRDIPGFLMQKVLTAEDIRPATQLLGRIRGGGAQLAEILHILRPLIYAAAMARAASSSRTRGRPAWQPWLLGISVDLAARQLRHSSFSSSDAPGSLGETSLEKEEWARRAWSMSWWALRGAFYDAYSRSWLEAVAGHHWVPGLVGGILQDYGFLWGEYHFSSADM